jgi:hypothetical protein
MMILNLRYCGLVAALACLSGCGGQAHNEAVTFAKALTAKKANFTSAGALEKDFISRARAWCTGITANGAGRGVALDQNSAMAAELAKSAVAISAQLSQVRQAVDGPSLNEEFTQDVRNTLVTQLTKRQRQLQDMRALLEQSAPQFLEYKQSKAYVGDTYPDGIGKLDAMLHSYHAPEDALGTALGALQTKYNLTGAEL